MTEEPLQPCGETECACCQWHRRDKERMRDAYERKEIDLRSVAETSRLNRERVEALLERETKEHDEARLRIIKAEDEARELRSQLEVRGQPFD